MSRKHKTILFKIALSILLALSIMTPIPIKAISSNEPSLLFEKDYSIYYTLNDPNSDISPNATSTIHQMLLHAKAYDWGSYVELNVEVQDPLRVAKITKIKGSATLMESWTEYVYDTDSRTTYCFGTPVGAISFTLIHDVVSGVKYVAYGTVYVTISNGTILNGGKIDFNIDVTPA